MAHQLLKNHAKFRKRPERFVRDFFIIFCILMYVQKTVEKEVIFVVVYLCDQKLIFATICLTISLTMAPKETMVGVPLFDEK